MIFRCPEGVLGIVLLELQMHSITELFREQPFFKDISRQ